MKTLSNMDLVLELSFLVERYHQKRDELNRTDLFKPGIICDYSFAKSLVFARINLDPDEFEFVSKPILYHSRKYPETRPTSVSDTVAQKSPFVR